MTLQIRILCILTLSIFGVVGASVSAFAHAGLETSIPATGEALKESPKEIVLIFSEDIRAIGIAVLDTDGQKVGNPGQAKADGKELRIRLREPLTDGAYKVDFQVVGLTDSHPIAGSITFSVQSHR